MKKNIWMTAIVSFGGLGLGACNLQEAGNTSSAASTSTASTQSAVSATEDSTADAVDASECSGDAKPQVDETQIRQDVIDRLNKALAELATLDTSAYTTTQVASYNAYKDDLQAQLAEVEANETLPDNLKAIMNEVVDQGFGGRQGPPPRDGRGGPGRPGGRPPRRANACSVNDDRKTQHDQYCADVAKIVADTSLDADLLARFQTIENDLCSQDSSTSSSSSSSN